MREWQFCGKDTQRDRRSGKKTVAGKQSTKKNSEDYARDM